MPKPHERSSADEPLFRGANQLWDAIVIGAGPAGCIAARELARLGKQVLLVDKATFPRHKTCGGCLNASALGLLEEVGLKDLLDRIYAQPLTSLLLSCKGQSVSFPLNDNLAVSRNAFDAALAAEAVASGVSFVAGVTARPDDHADACAGVRLRWAGQDYRTRAKTLVVATGLSGWRSPGSYRDRGRTPSSRIGAGARLLDSKDLFAPGTVHMAVSQGGYVGAVRLADGQIDVAGAFDRQFLQEAGSPTAAAARVMQAAQRWWPSEMTRVRWTGTPPLTHRPRHVAGWRLFVIGDAAGYAEPFTGEGMAWAMRSAVAGAPLAAQSIEACSPSIAAEWEHQLRLLDQRRWLCMAIGKVLRRPKLAHLAVRVLSRAPWLAGPLLSRINGR